MTRRIPNSIETYDAMDRAEDGSLTFAKVEPESNAPGFRSRLVPFYTLSDRGTFFVPGAFKKTIKERRDLAPHLWQHDTWLPLGKHTDAVEEEDAFRVRVEVNEDIQAGAELMSNLRFGVPLGQSIGIDPIGRRTGTKADDVKLDRSLAPDSYQNVPINELTAITEARWWESSSVTFAGIANAVAETIYSTERQFEEIIRGLQAGSLSDEQLAGVQRLVAAYESRAAVASGTAEDEKARRDRVLARVAAYHGVRAVEMGVA